MKKILYVLLFVNFIFASQSKYPLDFSFEEESLFLSHITLVEDNNHTVISIVFNNNQDEIFILSNSIVELPGCNIKTLNQITNILNLTMPEPCKRAFELHGKQYKTIQLKPFTILLYKNEKSNLKTAFIFEKDTFAATMMSNMSSNEFIEILLSLKKRKREKSEDVDQYINDCKKYLKKGLLNRSFQQLVSAFLLDAKNKTIHDLYHQLTKKRMEKIKLFDNFYFKK